MWRRGANLDGDTANFIETEQLVEFEDFRTAFLQVDSQKMFFRLYLFLDPRHINHYFSKWLDPRFHSTSMGTNCGSQLQATAEHIKS